MLNDAMQIILQFRVFLIAVIVVALVLEIALALGTRTFGWQKRNLWIYGFFFGLTTSQCYFGSFLALAAICSYQCSVCRRDAGLPSGTSASFVSSEVWRLEAEAHPASRSIQQCPALCGNDGRKSVVFVFDGNTFPDSDCSGSMSADFVYCSVC